ncbi:hypothetical protein ABIF70_003276 [Bradyrhizobium japonicum]
MIETAMIFSPNLPADVRACPPAQGSPLQSAKVFLQYLDNNPDRANEPGITVAIEAFRDAWPCRGDDAGTGLKKRAPKKIQIERVSADTDTSLAAGDVRVRPD